MKWLLTILAIYAVIAAGMAVFQRRLMYFPDRHLTRAAEAGIAGIEDLRLLTEDGERLVAWFLPPRERYPLILYFHGNGGALIDRAPRFRLFAARGYGFLAVSYRGYGGSTGSPTEAGLIRDGEAAYGKARALGYTGDRIVLMGESLGASVAAAVAASHEAAALVLDAPFSSAVDVAAAHYRVLPVRWLMLDRFRSDVAIGKVHIPVLMVHGGADDVVPINLARRLFQLASEPKTFMAVPGGGHPVLGLPEVFSRVCAWIDARTGVKHGGTEG